MEQIDRRVAILVIVAVLVFVGGALVIENKTVHGTVSHVAQRIQKTVDSASTKHASQGTSTVSSSGSSKTAAADKPSASPAAQTPSACENILTTKQASSVIGAVVASSGDGVTSQTGDMTTVRCAYTAGSDTASVVAYIARTTNGNNANEIEFGSGRPSNATPVSGYGNSAFWLADNSQLNILQSNNWYVLSITKGGASTLQLNEQLATAAKLTASY